MIPTVITTTTTPVYTSTTRTTHTIRNPVRYEAYRTAHYSNANFPNYGITMSMIDNSMPTLFKKYDKDLSGFIEPWEFYTLMCEFLTNQSRPLPTEEECNAWYRQLDTNGDGRLSYDELCMLLTHFGDRPVTPSIIEQYRTLPVGTDWRSHFNYI